MKWLLVPALALTLIISGGCIEKLDQKAGISAAQIELVKQEASTLRAKSLSIDSKIEAAKKGIEGLPFGDSKKPELVAFLEKLQEEKAQVEEHVADAVKLLDSYEFDDEKTFANTLKGLGITAQSVGASGVAGPYTPWLTGGGGLLIALAGWLERDKKRKDEKADKEEAEAKKAALKTNIKHAILSLEKAKDDDGNIDTGEVKMTKDAEDMVKEIRLEAGLSIPA